MTSREHAHFGTVKWCIDARSYSVHLGRVITSPRCTVGRVNPSSSAFYQSKGRVDGSLDEPMMAHAGTLKMVWQKDRMINCEVKTRGLFTHLQPSAINSNLHNKSHNEDPRSRVVFSTCFDDVFRGNNDAAHVVNAGSRGCERAGLNGMHGSTPDYAGFNDSRRRAASARGATICADQKIAKLAFLASDNVIFFNSNDIAKRSYT